MRLRRTVSVAFARKARSDLRRHRAQAVVLLVVLAAASAALALSVTLQAEASHPWDRQFVRAHGAHVWAIVRERANLNTIVEQPEVAQVAGPYDLGYPTLIVGDQRVGVTARAMAGDNHPPVGRLTLSSGRWLRGPDELVIEHSLAEHLHLRAGTSVVVNGEGTPARRLFIAGIAVTTDSGPYGSGLARAYVLPSTLDQLVPADRRAVEVGVRLRDPSGTPAFVAGVLARVPANDLFGAWTWTATRSQIREQTGQVTSVLGLFGVFLLGAATLVLLNAVASRVVAQSRDVGLLKAIGWTPRQVFALFLGEHLALACGGLVLGTGIAAAIGPPLAGGAARSVGLSAGGISRHGLTTVWLGVIGVVAAATAVPAWRASRLPTVDAIASGLTPRSSRRSRLARAAGRVGFGPPVVVGFKNSFARPLRAWLTVGGLAVTVITVTFALVGWSTIDAFDHHPERLGVRHQLDVYTGTPARTALMIANQAGVKAVYPTMFLPARLAGHSEPLTVRAIGSLAAPYPLDVRTGRALRAPGEGLVGSGLNLRVGDTAQINLWGRTIPIHIVGRYLESPDGNALTISQDTLWASFPRVAPREFSVVLAKSVSPRRVRAALLHANNQLTVYVVKATDTSLTGVRVAIAGMSIILLLIGLGNLLVTALLGVADRTRETGLLKSVGFTPRQVRTAVIGSATTLGLTALALGIPVGLALARVIGDQQTSSQGLGTGVIQLPSTAAIVLFAIGGLMASGVSALIPAMVAARMPAARALRAE